LLIIVIVRARGGIVGLLSLIRERFVLTMDSLSQPTTSEPTVTPPAA
jgi:hypothetical protein